MTRKFSSKFAQSVHQFRNICPNRILYNWSGFGQPLAGKLKESRTCTGVSSAKSFSFNCHQDESYTLLYRSHNSSKTTTSRVNYSIWHTFVFNFEKKTLRNHNNFVMAQPLVFTIVTYCTIVHTDYIIYLSHYETISFIRTPRKMCSP